jgi:nucleoside triphosphate pyrophosphatase
LVKKHGEVLKLFSDKQLLMFKTNLPIYLASKSPRRKILIKQLGIKFKSFTVDMEEIFIHGESPIKAVKRLASEKLFEAEKIKSDGILITADTIVVLNNEIIGKPKNKKDAKSILEKLSSNKHYVYTGFAIKNSVSKNKIIDYEKTEVTFRELTSKEIKNYIASGSPMDKAGAYGIQDDFGAVFISKINGCYYNVVGLPLSKFYTAINEVV